MTPLTCTVRSAREATGLGKTKIFELIASGRLESVKIDGRRMVIVESLLRLTSPRYGPQQSSELRRTDPVQHERGGQKLQAK